MRYTAAPSLYRAQPRDRGARKFTARRITSVLPTAGLIATLVNNLHFDATQISRQTLNRYVEGEMLPQFLSLG
jgi:hypothetical protein